MPASIAETAQVQCPAPAPAPAVPVQRQKLQLPLLLELLPMVPQGRACCHCWHQPPPLESKPWGPQRAVHAVQPVCQPPAVQLAANQHRALLWMPQEWWALQSRRSFAHWTLEGTRRLGCQREPPPLPLLLLLLLLGLALAVTVLLLAGSASRPAAPA